MKRTGISLFEILLFGVATLSTPSLHGQTTFTVGAPALTIRDVAIAAATATQADPVPATNVSPVGLFYSAQDLTLPPVPGNFYNLPVWSLGDNCFLLDDLEGDLQAASSFGGRVKDDASPPGPGNGGGGTNGNGYNNGFSYTFSTNGLWMQFTGITNGLAYLNLENATDQVYEVWSSDSLTNPLTNWNIEQEVWPITNQSVTPFTVEIGDRTNDLFFWARDWTGVTANGNQTPSWWFYYWFGTLSGLSDTNLDPQGNTLLDDYEFGLDPNIIAFSLSVTNQYFNTSSATVQALVSAGVPSYAAVLVDNTNVAGATWNVYNSSNIPVNLGPTQGWHNVLIGLRGLAPNATQTWEGEHLNLAKPPILVITNPALTVVSQPMIQISGYCQEPLSSISYDISNAAGVATNQPSEITEQYYDTNACGFTSNYFACLDVPLTVGINTITLHATDLAGATTITNFNFTVDYSTKTNPPVVQINWPQNGTQISGSSFTCRGWISDPTAMVMGQLGSGGTAYPGLVERNGNFWLQNLPLGTGTNTLTITVVDVVSNTTVTNISVIQSAVGLTVNPVTPASQLWQPAVGLSGTISDPTYAVWVNGVKGTNNGNGTWCANNVPVNSGGTANFTATAYAPNEQQPDGSYGN